MKSEPQISKIGGQRPLSLLVREHLEGLIRDGSFPAGSKLPREEELTDLLDVSRPTLREALKSMEADGMVVRKRGVGTFVRDVGPLRNNLNLNFGVTDLIESLGRRAGSTSVTFIECVANEEDARRLSVPEKEPLIRIERVRTADGIPVVYSVDVLTRRLAGGLDLIDEGEQSVYRALKRRGVKVRDGMASIRPVSADPTLAKKLGVSEGAPLLMIDQVDFDAADNPVLHSLEWHLSDAFEMTVHRRGPD